MTGTSGLIAKASDPYGIKQVTFILTGGSVHNMVIGRAHKTIYGWAASWNTSRVANGTYTVRSVAYGEIGTSSHSAEVQNYRQKLIAGAVTRGQARTALSTRSTVRRRPPG